MDFELTSLPSEELVQLYHKVNSELKTHLLNGAPWKEQQDRIKTLNQISRELSQRKIEVENQKVLK